MSSSQSSTQPSLQQLAENKAVDEILRPNFKYSDFASLEPRLQQLLFERLRTEVIQLRQVDKAWSCVRQYCPETDRQLYQEYLGIEYPEEDDAWSCDGVQDFTRELLDLRDQWKHSERELFKVLDIKSEYTISWDHRDLFLKSPGGNFKIWPAAARQGLSADELQHLQETRLSKQISPQLLFYRVILLFGIPPELVKHRHNYWGRHVNLEPKDGNVNSPTFLAFGYYGNNPYIQFAGSQAGSDQALNLLRHLCETKYFYR